MKLSPAACYVWYMQKGRRVSTTSPTPYKLHQLLCQLLEAKLLLLGCVKSQLRKLLDILSAVLDRE